jgi:osmotically-inducible protein OsmY
MSERMSECRSDTQSGLSWAATSVISTEEISMGNDIYATGDTRIAEAVEAEIEARMHPKARPIDVSVSGANVTLTGYVANASTKEAVIKMARDTDGVINVIDNLEVGEGHPFLDWFMPWRNPNKDLEADSKGEW